MIVITYKHVLRLELTSILRIQYHTSKAHQNKADLSIMDL